MRSLRFRPYPDTAAALGRLRQLGVRTAVVSNWDVSLRGILAELGLGGLVDGGCNRRAGEPKTLEQGPAVGRGRCQDERPHGRRPVPDDPRKLRF